MKVNRTATILFLILYGLITFVGRLYIEPFLGVSPLGSLAIGLLSIGFVIMLFRTGFLTLQKHTPGQKSA
ncbi:hypothetical protein AB9P05_11480 [Roseivirga sp. BDSF3-8]|uniref:hypothetical protein n=1 Tax=Roseivirga sp. BDSF3-8 TaxID=3241598 RepID=UPI00353252AF